MVSPWRISGDEMQVEPVAGGGRRQALPSCAGSGETLIHRVDPDLDYVETRYSLKRDLAILSRVDTAEPRLVLTLGLVGTSRYVSARDEEVVFRAAYTTVTSFASSLGERQYQSHDNVVQLRLSLTSGWLERHLDDPRLPELFERGALRVISHRPTSATACIAARQLLSGPPTPSLNRLFLHGQALTILAAELDCLFPDTASATAGYSARDIAAAHQARAMLLDELRSPPTVGQLARRVGINEFKLKKLIHILYGTTPYALLLEARMHAAYRMLESTRCQVAAAADAVGYRHPGNFTTAFIKYFGVSPKTIRSKS